MNNYEDKLPQFPQMSKDVYFDNGYYFYNVENRKYRWNGYSWERFATELNPVVIGPNKKKNYLLIVLIVLILLNAKN